MPIYEYECSECRCHFEKRQRFSDEAVANCPKCHAKSKRVMCPAPVIFKGSGFYVTDYRPKGSEGNSCLSPGPSTNPSPSPSPSPSSS